MKEGYTAREIAEALGITKVAIIKRANKENWPFREENNPHGGGRRRVYMLESLPSDVQKALIQKSNNVSVELLPALAPEAALEAARRMLPVQSIESPPAEIEVPSSWISEDVLRDDYVCKVAHIVQEATNPPRDYRNKRSRWIELTAIKHGLSRSQIYRYIKKYDTAGLAGLKHRKSSRGKARSWSPEAIDFWVGLVLKREHRKISKKALYECLALEASKRGWQIGSFRSALWWLEKKISPQLLALQRGGVRALDNTLPPILRDYSDLAPFEMLVGDQHRFDFWVVDDETGEVFRPEGYLWQDLRTRLLYGCAIAKRYDAFLMGLSLRMGLMVFGAFQAIYTDHGKPEESRYIASILKEMKALGLSAFQTVEMPADVADADPEELGCMVTLPGTHRKAVVRNAKAKMIESTNRALENILRNELKTPGYVKRLISSKEEQEIDQKEAERLAQAGKLLTFHEFVLAVLKAMDYYNSRKPHRGVLREWKWRPRPRHATPMQCLAMCYLSEEWRPVRMSKSALDLIFLPRESRIVDRGRVRFQRHLYEHEALVTMNGQRVDIRYDPLDPEWLLVFHNNEFICQAELVEYSSMKDLEIASRKIQEKIRLRKYYVEQYRKLTSKVPDFREYSRVPALEKVAALVGKERRARKQQQAELYRERTPEELAAEVAKLEAAEKALRPKPKLSRPLPARPLYFLTDLDRYSWCMEYEAAGGTLSDEDRAFKAAYESRMSEDEREYWQTVLEYGRSKEADDEERVCYDEECKSVQ